MSSKSRIDSTGPGTLFLPGSNFLACLSPWYDDRSQGICFDQRYKTGVTLSAQDIPKPCFLLLTKCHNCMTTVLNIVVRLRCSTTNRFHELETAFLCNCRHFDEQLFDLAISTDERTPFSDRPLSQTQVVQRPRPDYAGQRAPSAVTRNRSLLCLRDLLGCVLRFNSRQPESDGECFANRMPGYGKQIDAKLGVGKTRAATGALPIGSMRNGATGMWSKISK